jgi:hypothetical protein
MLDINMQINWVSLLGNFTKTIFMLYFQAVIKMKYSESFHCATLQYFPIQPLSTEHIYLETSPCIRCWE